MYKYKAVWDHYFFCYKVDLSSYLIMNSNNNNSDVKPVTSESNHVEKYQQDQYDNSLCEEQLEHVPKGTASFGRIVFMLLKAFIGTGVIFLPGS